MTATADSIKSKIFMAESLGYDVIRMMLGIVGSPRRGRLTDQLVNRALEGSRSMGTEARRIYLFDFGIESYTEGRKGCPEELSELCEEADAIILGAPVYYGDINGLTKDFMDTVRISNANGKYALGISIAGGTGKGLCSGIQSIYHFFYHRQLRGIDPTPVSRFNFEEALRSLYESGRKLAKLSKEKKPFSDLWDRIECYEKLDYMNYTFLDEILLLAEQLIEISSNKEDVSRAKEEYEIAKSLINEGNRIRAAKHAVKAYDMLYF